jgi:hypothetical protein
VAIGIFASDERTVTANGISITSTCIWSSLSRVRSRWSKIAGRNKQLGEFNITTNGIDADALHAFDANNKIFGTNLTITTYGVPASGAETDNGGLIEITGGTITTYNVGAFGLFRTDNGNITAAGMSITISGAGCYGLFPLNGGRHQRQRCQ